jgi:hypothetical protein
VKRLEKNVLRKQKLEMESKQPANSVSNEKYLLNLAKKTFLH